MSFIDTNLKKLNIILISERDNGIYDAMNKGLAHASGDVICFLNSDDFFAHENIISNIVNIFREKNIDIVHGQMDPLKIKEILDNFKEGNINRVT